MKSTAVAITAALLTFTTATAAFACSLAPEGWFAMTDSVRAQPAGPYIVPLDNYYGYDTAPVVTITAVDANTAVVMGESEIVVVGVGQAFLVWTPESALDPNGSYSAMLDFDQAADLGSNMVALVPVVDLGEFAVSVTSVGGAESATPASRECCRSDEACFTDSCGDNNGQDNCQTCWTTSWNYVIRPRMVLDITAAQTGRYLLELAYVADGGERTALGETLVLEAGATTLSGRALDVGQDVPVCLELTAIDVITGDSEVLASECAAEADIERSDRDREVGIAPDYCESNSFTEIDETGEERPIAGPGKAADDGCSAVGTGAASWLLLLVAGFARRRRRTS